MQASLEELSAVLHDREELRAQLEYEASHDPLTGLLNRRGFRAGLDEALTSARELGAPITALVLDVDGFKAINDLHGHTVGDTLLTAIAERLRDSAAEADVVGRMGGDEFLVVATIDEAEAHELGARIKSALEAPFTLYPADGGGSTGGDEERTPPTISVGVSVGYRTSTSERDEPGLIQAADAAAYFAKAHRSGEPVAYTEEIRDWMRVRTASRVGVNRR